MTRKEFVGYCEIRTSSIRNSCTGCKYLLFCREFGKVHPITPNDKIFENELLKFERRTKLEKLLS